MNNKLKKSDSTLAKVFNPERMIANMKKRKRQDVAASIARSKHNAKLRSAESQIDSEALSTKYH